MVTAQFVAEVGDGITLVALPLYVFDRTESALLTSLTFAAELTLGIAFSVVGGVFADAFDRQRILLVSYAVRAALLTIAFAVDPLLFAVSAGVLGRALGMGDNPSFDALVPGQARGDLQQVLAVRRFVQAVSITVGPAAGALLVTAVGPRPALAVNGATFLIALLVLATVPGLDTDVDARRRNRYGLGVMATTTELLRGMGLVLRLPGIRLLTVYQALGMGAVSIVIASAVVWFEEVLDAGVWYGLSIASYGIGSALGLVIAGGRRFRIPLPRLILAMAPVYASCCALGVAAEIPWLMSVSFGLWGLALGPEMVLGEVFFVGQIPESSRGRGFAALGVAITVGMSAGYVAAGPLLEAFGPRTSVLTAAVFLAGLGLLWIEPARHPEEWAIKDDGPIEPVSEAGRSTPAG